LTWWSLLLQLPREWPLLNLACSACGVWNTLFGYVLGRWCSLSSLRTGPAGMIHGCLLVPIKQAPGCP